MCRVDYEYGTALGTERDARGEPAILFALPSWGDRTPAPLGLRTDLMWDPLEMLATLDETIPGVSAWDDRLPEPIARYPGDEEEDFDEDIDDEDDLDEDLDDEDEDLDDEDFDDEDEDLDDDLNDEIDDIDVEEEDDLDEEDEDLDDLEDEEDEDLDDL
ncbi:MAG TPA: hypothetical protein VKP69_30360 [Isosphaeraceae bacterium]|nr:hypothetical protein [Isosphaeraceae bacterium]